MNHAKSFYGENKIFCKTLILVAIVISVFTPNAITKKMEVKAYMKTINKI